MDILLYFSTCWRTIFVVIRKYVESYINVAFIIEIDMQLLKFSHVKEKYGPLGRVKKYISLKVRGIPYKI